MNENIDNMFEDLEKEFPENVCQKFVLIIYDNNGNIYFEDYEFQEELFSNLFIYYRGNALEIIKDQYNLFDINTDMLIEQEDLATITKAMSIVAKHLSKINFKSHL